MAETERPLVASHRGRNPNFQESAADILSRLMGNLHLKEKDLVRLLVRRDLPSKVIEAVAAHPVAERSYAVRLLLARHPHTPRMISLTALKHLYLFDLVGAALAPAAPADVRRAAEEAVLKRMGSLPRGEKITLARRGPGRVAAALMITSDRLLIAAALDNPYLTEAQLIQVLSHRRIPSQPVEILARHPKWSRRYQLRLAMIRHPLTPFYAVLGWLADLAVGDLRQVALDSAMPDPVRRYILAHCAARSASPPRRSN
jgi:hypothetical protein